MEVVPSRDPNTLLPIIQTHTAPGTTIHSDQWRTYNSVSTLTGVTAHRVVNHSLHFVARPWNQCPHPNSRELLEQGEDKTEENEGL